MIQEVTIYADGTVDCLDQDGCLISSASGSWNIIPDLIDWFLYGRPSELPNECRFYFPRFYFGVRGIGDKETQRIQFSANQFIKLKPYIKQIECKSTTIESTTPEPATDFRDNQEEFYEK